MPDGVVGGTDLSREGQVMTATMKPEERSRKTASPSPPWRTDVRAARREALREGRPCVLLLNIESSAL
jgi:hypothetical protein